MLFEPHHPRLAQARSRSGSGPLLDRQTFVPVCGSSPSCRYDAGAVLAPVTSCLPPASAARDCLGPTSPPRGMGASPSRHEVTPDHCQLNYIN
jgi:hypothetical protein